MADRKCTRCGAVKPPEQFHIARHRPCGLANDCRDCANAKTRAYRAASGNADTRRYEKTKRGFLMRAYRNMKSRVNGVQRQKAHLYAGKALAISRDEFYEWGFTSAEFHELFAAWEASGYARQYTPSVDRIDSSRGYEFENMEWVTHSENSRRGGFARWRKRAA